MDNAYGYTKNHGHGMPCNKPEEYPDCGCYEGEGTEVFFTTPKEIAQDAVAFLQARMGMWMIKKLILALILLSLPALSWAGPAPGIKTPTFNTFGQQTITEYKANGGVDLGFIDRQGNISVYRSDGSAVFGEIDRRGNVTTFETEGYRDREERD